VPHAVATALQTYGINITTTEAGLISASDLEQTTFAQKENRGFFTHDRDFGDFIMLV
jgi:predicted nuclease of predicted toxin-antitoxin system